MIMVVIFQLLKHTVLVRQQTPRRQEARSVYLLLSTNLSLHTAGLDMSPWMPGQ